MGEGRVALVTGSAGGLGQALAEGLAGQGCRVMLHGMIEPTEGDAIAASIAAQRGVDICYHRADFSTTAGVNDLVNATQERLGPIDILINNAVVRHFSPVESFSPEDWDEGLAVNISAPFHAIRLTMKGMQARNWGRIVNISSVYGFRGVANRVAYVTTKTAMVGLTRAIAMEVAGTGITCNAVCPGTLPTPNILDRIEGLAKQEGMTVEESTRRYLGARQPSGEFVSMEGVASLVVFLCNDAARDINGAALPVDGALTAG